jgi:hypothetical protein
LTETVHAQVNFYLIKFNVLSTLPKYDKKYVEVPLSETKTGNNLLREIKYKIINMIIASLTETIVIWNLPIKKTMAVNYP